MGSKLQNTAMKHNLPFPVQEVTSHEGRKTRTVADNIFSTFLLRYLFIAVEAGYLRINFQIVIAQQSLSSAYRMQ